ncbi:MAG TPA: glycosyltransferase [Bryobacteraceae bacterium]|nr:glycosyltransferase [Bryobacteraceae bacterium]
MSVTVLIPVYRNQTGLNRSLESLADAEGEFDVLIVDDGSPHAIEAPQRLRNDVPVTVLRLPRNQGIAAALNHGLRHLLPKGIRYVARLDSGDTIVPKRFRAQQEFMDANPGCAVVSSFVDFVDAERGHLFRYRAPTSHAGIVRRLRRNNCVMHPGSMIRASALRQAGIYREDVPGAEDYELFLRLAQRYTLAVLPEVLTHMEYSLGGLSIAGRRRQQWQRLRLQLRYFDHTSFHSFCGVACTLLTMAVPHDSALQFKRAYLR